LGLSDRKQFSMSGYIPIPHYPVRGFRYNCAIPQGDQRSKRELTFGCHFGREFNTSTHHLEVNGFYCELIHFLSPYKITPTGSHCSSANQERAAALDTPLVC